LAFASACSISEIVGRTTGLAEGFMDSQALAPISSRTTGPATETAAASDEADPGKRVTSTAAASDAVHAKPVEVTVRSRDPRSLQFQVDSSTFQVVATVVDDADKTVVVQVPDEETLRIAKSIDRMQGFLLEEKA
jgi:flagellar protein FlaG